MIILFSLLILLVCFSDVVLTGTNSRLIEEVKQFIYSQFRIKDFRLLKFFLGLEVAQSDIGLHINQHKYALNLIHEPGLSNGD